MKKKYLMISLSLAVIINLVLLIPNFNPPAVSAETITLKFANYFPPPARHSKLIEEFAERLEERTQGRIKIDYFAGGSLLKAPAIYKGVVSGIADMGLSHIEYTPGRFPVTGATELPVGYPSGWVSNQVVNDFYHKFKPKEWRDVKVLWLHAGTPCLIISKKPVRKLDDLRGLKIRAPGMVGKTLSALGGTPTPTPIMEVYDAISKGVIDGVNTPFETLKSFRFAEVAKYTPASWQVGNTYTFFVVMNKNSYKKIPADLKPIFDQLCGEYKERYALMWNQIDFEGRNFALQKGVEIIDLSPAEVIKWKQAAAPVIDDYTKDMVKKGYSEAEVKSWFAYIDERTKYWLKTQIPLYIKSPTGPPEIRP